MNLFCNSLTNFSATIWRYTSLSNVYESFKYIQNVKHYILNATMTLILCMQNNKFRKWEFSMHKIIVNINVIIIYYVANIFCFLIFSFSKICQLITRICVLYDTCKRITTSYVILILSHIVIFELLGKWGLLTFTRFLYGYQIRYPISLLQKVHVLYLFYIHYFHSKQHIIKLNFQLHF